MDCTDAMRVQQDPEFHRVSSQDWYEIRRMSYVRGNRVILGDNFSAGLERVHHTRNSGVRENIRRHFTIDMLDGEVSDKTR